MIQVSYGTSAGPGLAQEVITLGAQQAIDSNDPGNNSQPIVVSTLPAQVPIMTTPPVPDGSTNTAVVGTSAVPAPTPVTPPATLGSFLAGVIANPGQHLIAVGILVLLGWWFYKHVLKKF